MALPSLSKAKVAAPERSPALFTCSSWNPAAPGSCGRRYKTISQRPMARDKPLRRLEPRTDAFFRIIPALLPDPDLGLEPSGRLLRLPLLPANELDAARTGLTRAEDEHPPA